MVDRREGQARLPTPARSNGGQVMLLTVLTLGGTILSATTIAGLLMLYQIRQTSDLANSGRAIFAADAGVEWGLYQFIKREGQTVTDLPVFSNDSSVVVVCGDAAGDTVPCNSTSTLSIRAVGTSRNAARAFDVRFE